MKKEEFLRDIGNALSGISEKERQEILYDYEEHFMICAQNGKTEEEICEELGDPKEIADNYLLNLTKEEIKLEAKEEQKSNGSITLDYRKRNLFAVFAIVIAVILFLSAGILAVNKHNDTIVKTNSDGIEVGGIKIDSSGIHGDGISIDNDGVKVPGVTVSEDGIKAPGVSIDDNGVKVPGVSIDNNGVKVDLPKVKVNVKE